MRISAALLGQKQRLLSNPSKKEFCISYPYLGSSHNCFTKKPNVLLIIDFHQQLQRMDNIKFICDLHSFGLKVGKTRHDQGD